MKNNKGFSLVELIVVIAIMAILAAVAIPTFATFITKANVASDESYMNDIEYAVELELAQEGGIPADYAIKVEIDNGVLAAITWEYIGNETDEAKIPEAPAYNLGNLAAVGVIDTSYEFKGLEDGTYIPDTNKPGHWKTAG